MTDENKKIFSSSEIGSLVEDFDKKLDIVAEGILTVDKKVDRLEQRFGGLEQRQDRLELGQKGLEHHFDGLEQRFDKLTEEVMKIKGEL